MRKNNYRKLLNPYAAGLLSGFLLFLLCAALLAGYIAQQGIIVYFDSTDLAEIIRERVIKQARAELPKVIAEAKADIPAVVAKEMKNFLQSDRMEIAGFVFRMPAELMNELRLMLQTNVENATEDILDGIDTTMLADQLGADTYHMIRESFEEELAGQSFTVMVLHRFPLEVQIRMRDTLPGEEAVRINTE